MDRLLVTARLATPVIFAGGHMTLDAILGAVLYDELQDVAAAHDAIPIRCDDGLYHASSAIPEESVTQPYSIVAGLNARHKLTPDLIRLNRQGTDSIRKIGLNRRRDYGNVKSDYRLLATPSLTWYVEGRADEVRRLLDRIDFLGKKRAQGFGEVSRFEIAETGESPLVSPFGSPLRPIPVDRFDGDRSLPTYDMAWRPPYWDIRNRARCYAPELVA